MRADQQGTVFGSEDVLDGEYPAGPVEPEPLDPAERTRFRTGLDVLAAVLIVIVALLVGLLIWQGSEIRATTHQTNPEPVPEPQLPTVFPPSLGEAWRAPSSATQVPVAAGPVVVTGDGGEVAGRDPLTGEVLWRYARDLPLCTIAPAFSLAIAVYRTDGGLLPAGDSRAGGGCSEAIAFDPATGLRGKQRKPDEPVDKPQSGQRHTDAEVDTRLLYDGTYVTTTGRRLLTTWRSDLVQTMEYGTLPAIVNSGKQPRTDCTYGSVAVASGRIGVIERCGSDPGDRLTVYRATNSDNKADEPAVVFSVVVGSSSARVVAMSAATGQERTAVVLPDPSRLVVYDDQGKQVAEYPLGLPEQDLRGDPPGLVVPTTPGAAAVYWYTGSRTIALHSVELRPLWTVQGTLGAGTIFAGRALFPVVDGIRVVDQATGEFVGTIPVDRAEYSGPVTMSTIGPMVLEQRGANLVALR
ncbi:MAG TPA: PQQ-binding-like beta-propeller repeat protein [Actinophytocola sp.]|uniref:Rv3212 family protein n=1 Tax=Actinophytocola sp. TaxID=1872138 RepID=UPI002DDD814C|nr:PQQ-binding-like beta-propeller repeat protein [Actinophytocola sp.]HEV2778809.1 PQQ-binding-like beta-propeller repeat protein [Actinophytocola sp.]